MFPALFVRTLTFSVFERCNELPISPLEPQSQISHGTSIMAVPRGITDSVANDSCRKLLETAERFHSVVLRFGNSILVTLTCYNLCLLTTIHTSLIWRHCVITASFQYRQVTVPVYYKNMVISFT